MIHSRYESARDIEENFASEYFMKFRYGRN